MRAIALAILLAAHGIEGTLLRVYGKEWANETVQGIFVLMLLVAFLVCLIGGW